MPRSERRSRIANFVASVNNSHFLIDTENRRYMCFEVEMCSPSQMPNMDDVWAKAFTLYKNGEQHWFTADEYGLINAINEDYAEITSEQEWLQICYHPATADDHKANRVEYLTASEIKKKLSEVSNDKTLNANRLGRALKRLNFKRIAIWFAGKGSRKA